MPEDQQQQPNTDNTPNQGPNNVVSPPTDAVVGSIEINKPWHRYIREKYVYMPFIIVILIPIIGAIIASHYAILGLVFRQNYTVAVLDRKTFEPLIGATLTMRGQTVTTNSHGLAEFSKLRVGDTPISVSKSYYKGETKTVLLPLTDHHVHVYFLTTTGVEFHISVVNRVNKSPVDNAVITSGKTSGITDSSGKTILALPKSTTPLPATITAPEYNPTSVSVNEAAANNYQMIPSGKIYYLSNSSGPVDVMESNLDGSSPQVVLAGTSEQTLANTTLIPSSDWKYLALFTTRTNSTPAVYLIDTSNNKLKTIDTNSEGFVHYGWTAKDSLIYQYIHTDLGAGEALGSKLKAYDATTSKSYILDKTNELGYDPPNASSQTVTGLSILANGTILYTKAWTAAAPFNISSDFTTYNTVQPDGSSQKTLESISATQYPSPPQVVFTSPASVNVEFTGVGAPPVYYTYSAGKIAKSTAAAFIPAPTNSLYFVSPSDKSTLWSASVGGNNTLSVGDINASSPKAIATFDSSYSPLGWYTDYYVLVTQNGNQMSIIPSSGTNNQTNILKVTDYQ